MILFSVSERRGGGRRGAGRAFIVDTGGSGKSGKKRSNPRGARGRGSVKGDRRDRGGNGTQGGGEEEEGGQTTTRNVGDGTVDDDKRGKTKCNCCGEIGHKTARCSWRVCGVCGVEGHSEKSAPMSSLILRVEKT